MMLTKTQSPTKSERTTHNVNVCTLFWSNWNYWFDIKLYLKPLATVSSPVSLWPRAGWWHGTQCSWWMGVMDTCNYQVYSM